MQWIQFPNLSVIRVDMLKKSIKIGYFLNSDKDSYNVLKSTHILKKMTLFRILPMVEGLDKCFFFFMDSVFLVFWKDFK